MDSRGSQRSFQRSHKGSGRSHKGSGRSPSRSAKFKLLCPDIRWSFEVQRMKIRFARLSATYEFGEPRIVDFQSVTNNRAALRIDRLIVQDCLCSSFESVTDSVGSGSLVYVRCVLAHAWARARVALGNAPSRAVCDIRILPQLLWVDKGS